MDEFELAGFEEDLCKELRKLRFESGIEPECFIRVIRHNPAEMNYRDRPRWRLKQIIDRLAELGRRLRKM